MCIGMYYMIGTNDLIVKSQDQSLIFFKIPNTNTHLHLDGTVIKLKLFVIYQSVQTIVLDQVYNPVD